VMTWGKAMCRAVSKEELGEMLSHKAFESTSVPILFLANKMDLPHSMPHQSIAEAMKLPELAFQHRWKIMHCCGLTGEGVREGWDWLTQQLSQSWVPP
jgi:signal recognition particle receptor subunit beta